jgi:hypothetical protein
MNRKNFVGWLGLSAGVGAVGARLLRGTSSPRIVSDRLREGVELQYVFLVSPTCAVCQSRDFRIASSALLRHRESKVVPDGFTTASVFVGLGHDLDELVEMAGRFGQFDELVIGHGWTNLGAMRYVWRDFPAEGATPQVVVTRRDLRYNVAVRGIDVPGERVVRRLIGLPEILSWASRGYPVPGIEVPSPR